VRVQTGKLAGAAECAGALDAGGLLPSCAAFANNSRSEEEMFNPAATVAASKGQIEAVAEQNGFELTRGREIGARLLARRAANQR
jgi:hypothetical protein